MSDYQPQHASESEEEPVVGDAPPKADVLLSNSVFDKIKASSLYILPALAAAYFGIAQIWGLPKAEEVVGTVAVLETLLGALLKVSNVQYNNSEARFDGAINVETFHEEGYSNVNFQMDPAPLAHKNEVVLKVNRQ